MFNFKAGSGKSPSFFFFSDNKLLMLKTLKESEKKILHFKEFLQKYFVFITENPDSLLMRIYGIYQVDIKDEQSICFLITDNMVGNDFDNIHRCFDLKGSL